MATLAYYKTRNSSGPENSWWINAFFHPGRVPGSVAPCKPEVADRHSGYQVGGTSPLGTRRAMPVYVERTILDAPKVYVNGGSRGFLVGVAPKDLAALLASTLVDVAIEA